MLIPKQTIIRDKKHLKWIASLSCIITGSTDTQACHIRHNSMAGLGRKPSDDRVLPLSCEMHRRQHATSELKFWYDYGGVEKAIALAKRLYEISGNTELALEEIAKWKQ